MHRYPYLNSLKKTHNRAYLYEKGLTYIVYEDSFRTFCLGSFSDGRFDILQKLLSKMLLMTKQLCCLISKP